MTEGAREVCTTSPTVTEECLMIAAVLDCPCLGRKSLLFCALCFRWVVLWPVAYRIKRSRKTLLSPFICGRTARAIKLADARVLVKTRQE